MEEKIGKFEKELLEKALTMGFEWIVRDIERVSRDKTRVWLNLYKSKPEKHESWWENAGADEDEANIPEFIAGSFDFMPEGELMRIRDVIYQNENKARRKFTDMGFEKSSFVDSWGTKQLTWEKETEYMSRLKVVFENGKCFLLDNNHYTHKMTPELISAITAQMKELGWM